ncbi:MAG: hypothetical protein NC342_03675 [Pseudoflavonifractor sp.]|nr:hypothetical protein [Pseudoflavonifractor sp.]
MNRILISALALIALTPCLPSSAAPRKVKRENAAELYRQAVEAFDAYDFETAASLLERASDALPAKGATDVTQEQIDELAEMADRGRLMLDRVEKIIVIDSIEVAREAFFEAYRLDPAAGLLRPASALPNGLEAVKESSVFIPENGLSMIWSAPDSLGNAVIAETSILADGSYETPELHPELSADECDALFPFLMADGVTLYYASDDPAISLGGFDILFTRRSGDSFLQPQNMGMPYNSPANDYLLAIDETTGTGWWATDRNNPEGDSLTIYRFIPNDLRVNYNSDDIDNITTFARLDNFKATQPAGTDYSELLARPVASDVKAPAQSFRLSIPGKGIVTSLDGLTNPQARRLARKWLDLNREIEQDSRRLDTLRRSYASDHRSVADEIMTLERHIPELRNQLKLILNDIVRAENNL